MSKNNENKLNEKESKSSQIIIISKGRLSSAKNNFNFMTLQEGKRKLTIKLKNETLNKSNISKAVSSLKKDMNLKTSRSFGKFENRSKKLENEKNDDYKSPLNEKEAKENIIQKIKLKSILSFETTKSINVKTTENNKEYNEDITNNNENEIKVNDLDLISNKENINLNNNLQDKNDYDIIKINDADTININEAKDENSNIEKNTNPNNTRKIISQNYFNNVFNGSKKIKIDSININKIEENQSPSTGRMNEENKKTENIRNVQQSEKTTKSIMGSMIAHGSVDNRENNKESNYLNIHRLMTENDADVKSGNSSVKSKNDLISNSKSRKIDEDDDEEDECEEVEDEYDEKVKNDNNRKLLKSVNVMKINNKFNEVKNKNDDNSKSSNDDRVIRSLTLSKNVVNDNIYTICCICEHTYNKNKLVVAECEEHYLCKRCTKNYYEEIIEDGYREIFCPFLKCRAPVDLEDLKKIIGPDHFRRLTNNYNSIEDGEETKNKFIFTKLKTNYNKGNAGVYCKKHVIDINSNKNFFNYNRIKDGYCPFCYEKSLFSKTNSHYYKCLYCLSKICRYCFKNYNEKHMDIHNQDHCKVYYRLDEEKDKINMFKIYFKQLFFVVSCFYLIFAGSFYIIKNIFFSKFNANSNKNCFKYFFCYFFAIIFFIMTIPILFLLYPYFPSILAFSDL